MTAAGEQAHSEGQPIENVEQVVDGGPVFGDITSEETIVDNAEIESDEIGPPSSASLESEPTPVAGQGLAPPVETPVGSEPQSASSVEAPVESVPAGEFVSSPVEAPVESVPAGEFASSPVETPVGSEPQSASPVETPDQAESKKSPEPGTGEAVPPQPVKPAVKVLEGVVTAVADDEVDLDLPDGRKAVIYRRNFGLQDEAPSSVLSVGDGAFGAELSRDDPKGRVVLSRSWVLKKQAWEKLQASSDSGQYITGKVVSVNKNGLVLDVGVRGFVPASHIELQPVKDLAPYVGQVIESKIIEINPDSERLVLSRRPILLREQRQKIKQVLSSLKPGDTKTGVVASLADYGAFVDLGGVKGLVHVSEMAWERVGKPSDVLSVGQKVEVKILDLNIKKRRIGLSIRQLTPDPLSGIEVGSVITGRVTRLVDFGAFVDIGVIEGLVHLSELAEYRVQAPEEVLTPGDQVGVKVLSVDPKRRRVALSVRQAAEFGG